MNSGLAEASEYYRRRLPLLRNGSGERDEGMVCFRNSVSGLSTGLKPTNQKFDLPTYLPLESNKTRSPPQVTSTSKRLSLTKRTM